MSNSWLTLADGKIGRKCLESFHNGSTFLKTIDWQYDGQHDASGAKAGGAIKIRKPNWFTVNTGPNLNVNDISEDSMTFTVATQKHVDFNWTSVEECLSLDDANERVFKPATKKLAAMVEYDILSNVYKDIFNLTGTTTAVPATVAAISNAGARLTQNQCPGTDRNLLLDPIAMSKTAQSVYTYFHKDSEIQKAFIENYIGTAAGFNWFESNMVPTHTNGARTGDTGVCNTSSGITSGSATITTTTDMGAVAVGDVFTIADVYAVDLETKKRLPHLYQFVIGTAAAASTTLTVSNPPITSGAKQNCELVSAGASKAVVFVAAGGSGTASAVYTQNLAYHKSAFAVSFAKLTAPDTGEYSYTKFDNVSMRVWKASDIKSDTHTCRIDVLYGYKTIRPEWAVRTFS